MLAAEAETERRDAQRLVDPTQVVGRRFALALLASAAAALAAIVLFVQLVDPYGVSPLKTRIEALNSVKPERVDIDRLIKPYEVWAKQPKTIFMGTSRIQQSIDPQALDGTVLAPAYNAAIPANNFAMNISNFEQYLKFNPDLERIYAELFIYNFLGQGQSNAPQDTWDYVQLVSPLFFSLSAVKAAWSTLAYNLGDGDDVYQIASGGNFHYPAGHDAAGPFAGFPAGIWAMHPQDDSKPKLSDASFVRMKEFAELAKANGVEIVFLATPNHAYSDYYFDFVDGWDVVAEWLRRASEIAPVVSFSQPNPLVYEPVSSDMTYWWDPFHFSLEMGRMMQLSLVTQAPADLPSNFMVRMTPDKVATHIAERRAGIRRWAEKNPAVADQIRAEYMKWGTGEEPQTDTSAAGPGEDLPPHDRIPSTRREQFAGAVESASFSGRSLRVTGWAADIVKNAPASLILVADGDTVLGAGRPSLDRPDIRQGLASEARPAGFDFSIDLPEADWRKPLQLFALFADGTVARLNASLPQAVNGVIESYKHQSMASTETRLEEHSNAGASAAPGASGELMNQILRPPAGIPPQTLEQFAGSVETATLVGGNLRISGWAADIPNNAPAAYIAIAKGQEILGWGTPSLDRPEIRQHLASDAYPAGYDFSISLPKSRSLAEHTLQIYAIFQDGGVVRLNANLIEGAGRLIAIHTFGE